MTLADLEGP